MLIGANTKSWGTTKKEYLPGGLLIAIKGKCKALVQEDSIKIGYLGNWMAVKFKYTGKVVAIIILYRILVLSSKGLLYSLTQYNKIDRKAKTPSDYRKELLNSIK